MNDDKLRLDVRILKAKGMIDKYQDCAEWLDISINSFYNWLGGYYTLSSKKKKILKDILDDLSID